MEHPGDHSVYLLARCYIPAGSQLTTSYVQPGLPTITRRTRLFNTWNFWCCCPACQDRTEGGTYRSGIACNEKCCGPVISKNPLSPDSSWMCISCSHEISHQQSQLIIQEAAKELESSSKCGMDVAELESI